MAVAVAAASKRLKWLLLLCPCFTGIQHHHGTDGAGTGSLCLYGLGCGLGAVRVTISHFSLMIKETSQLFVAGPPVVERGFGKPVEKTNSAALKFMPI